MMLKYRRENLLRRIYHIVIIWVRHVDGVLISSLISEWHCVKYNLQSDDAIKMRFVLRTSDYD